MASIMCLFGRDVLLPTSLRPQRRVRLVWRAIYRVHVHFIGHSRFVQFRIYLFAVHNTLSARARARYASAIRRIEVLREYVYFLSFSIPLWIPIATIRPSQFPLCGHTVNTCSCPKRIVETTIMAIIRSEKITKMKWKRFFFCNHLSLPEAVIAHYSQTPSPHHPPWNTFDSFIEFGELDSVHHMGFSHLNECARRNVWR